MRKPTDTTSICPSHGNLELPLVFHSAGKLSKRSSSSDDLLSLWEFGPATRKLVTTFPTNNGRTNKVPTFVNEFWTAQQRQASSLHEICTVHASNRSYPVFLSSD